jgi:hypothetical protein
MTVKDRIILFGTGSLSHIAVISLIDLNKSVSFAKGIYINRRRKTSLSMMEREKKDNKHIAE